MRNLMIAAGTFGSDGYGQNVDLNLLPDNLGGVVLKTTTLEPRTGNPKPNIIIHEDGSIINSIGLKNPGIKHIKIPEQIKCPVYLSLYAQSWDEWEELICLADKLPNLSGLELNLSCPNLDIKDSDIANKLQPTSLVKFTAHKTNLPVWFKLAPDSNSHKIAYTLHSYTKINGIILSNTVPAVDPETQILGGLSGPPLRYIAMRLIYLTHKQIPKLKIIACGGISNKDHINQYQKTGAIKFQVGSSFYLNNFKIPSVLLD